MAMTKIDIGRRRSREVIERVRLGRARCESVEPTSLPSPPSPPRVQIANRAARQSHESYPPGILVRYRVVII